MRAPGFERLCSLCEPDLRIRSRRRFQTRQQLVHLDADLLQTGLRAKGVGADRIELDQRRQLFECGAGIPVLRGGDCAEQEILQLRLPARQGRHFQQADQLRCVRLRKLSRSLHDGREDPCGIG